MVVAALGGLAWAQRADQSAPEVQRLPAAIELTRAVSGAGLDEVANTVRKWSEGNGLTELAPPTLSTLPTIFSRSSTSMWKPEIHRGMPMTTVATTTTVSSAAATSRSAPSTSRLGTQATRSASTTVSSPERATTTDATSAVTTTTLPTTLPTTAPTTSTSAPSTAASTSTLLSSAVERFSAGSASGGASYYDYVAGTCAHRTLPLGTIVKVTNTANGASTTCRVADRGPFITGRVIDLERSVFAAIAPISQGVAQVDIAW